MILSCVLFVCAAFSATGEDNAVSASVPMAYSVMDFGAVADGVTDNTAFFQEAMDEAEKNRGGIVEVPAGRYRFEGNLQIPSNVSLKGIFSYAPSHAGIRDAGQQQLPVYGSVLEPVASAGDAAGTPFITIQANGTVQGFTIHYPDQKPDADAPTPYPYTIAMRGNNPALIDMQLLNPYQGIDASENQRALVRNIHGQPIYIGIFVDIIYDIGRIENVHWNPWWTIHTKVYQWQLENGIGFLFGKTDWHYVHNTFCFGYNVGYKFFKSERGGTNGNFLGIGADDCYTSLLVEQSETMGILITNGEFVSFHGPDPTMIRVEETHTGTVRFVNCAFWGPARRNAVIDGVGTVGFSNCSFMQWGYEEKAEGYNTLPLPSIDVLGGSILLNGNEFMENKPQVHLGPKVERAIITDNLVNGKVSISNEARRKRVIIKNNLGFPQDPKFLRSLSERKDYRSRLLQHEMSSR
ncbi:MAG: hypothetical protein GX117_05670 [Candidatus Hydrogenedentes bacterium]|nr:hypothetical protein [Candidatus Hydrogenedentota bacterium]